MEYTFNVYQRYGNTYIYIYEQWGVFNLEENIFCYILKLNLPLILYFKYTVVCKFDGNPLKYIFLFSYNLQNLVLSNYYFN